MDTVMEDLSSKWDEIKESIRIEYEIPDISYKTWIDPLKLGDIKDDTVYIETPKELAQSIFIINKKFYTPFKIYINEALGKSFEDQYEIAFISENDKKVNVPDHNDIDKKKKYEESNLNSNYTFEGVITDLPRQVLLRYPKIPEKYIILCLFTEV